MTAPNTNPNLNINLIINFLFFLFSEVCQSFFQKFHHYLLHCLLKLPNFLSSVMHCFPVMHIYNMLFALHVGALLPIINQHNCIYEVIFYQRFFKTKVISSLPRYYRIFSTKTIHITKSDSHHIPTR